LIRKEDKILEIRPRKEEEQLLRKRERVGSFYKNKTKYIRESWVLL